LPAATLARVEAVAAGESGVACMDAMARELKETGYLHNHARMWWASFWIHVERLPWELGADFFFRHLIDADPASNTLSWRWVAGLQTPGKTYLVRRSNIEKYAPHYLRGHSAGSDRIADDAVTAAQVEATPVHPQIALPSYATSVATPSERRGLWLHPDDLVPEVGPLSSAAPSSVAACISDAVYQKTYRLSAQRIDSLHAALSDGLARASANFSCPSVKVQADDPAQGLCDWAVAQKLREIVAFAPMVGPIHDTLPRLTRQLGALGIRLTLVRRESDTVAFSFASAGFFPFWQKMSRHLSQKYQS
jgi:deoxyribodipyrimidine photo-lyase